MKYFLLLTVMLFSFSFGYAQKTPPDYSYIITTKRIVVKNEKLTTDDSSVYFIPVVSDKYPELKKTLSDTSLFDGKTIDTVVNEYKTEGIGTSFFSYGIAYADKNIISLQLYYETMGAQPDNSQRWLTLNIHTGKIYSIANEIDSTGLKWIFTNYKALIKARIEEEKVAGEQNTQTTAQEEENNSIYDDLEHSIDNMEFEEMLKNYVFTDKGVIFTTEDILPHVVHDREPARNWLIPYNKLKPYILPGAIVLKK